ncbi:uncharacterized protein LOC128551882 [Mercenaria mercenaria]|uniref:uncharacterized protein LOC128551882 n=1 Tax=Mercenaria mercenaria TaxID=6596 RepID=UPI00234FACCE|nr:uncharacterized protein LOC128551882 [Mercenaria mercenaria]
MDKFVKICSFLILTCGVVANSQKLVNIALYKPTFQDDTLHYPATNQNAIWSSEHAVDGKKNCVQPATYNDYSATAVKAEPWWQVDLGGLYNIKKVMVYGQPEKNPSSKEMGRNIALTEKWLFFI